MLQLSLFLLFYPIVVDQAAVENDLSLLCRHLAKLQRKRCKTAILYHVSRNLGCTVLYLRADIRDESPFANGSSPSSIRNGSIPQLIRFER